MAELGRDGLLEYLRGQFGPKHFIDVINVEKQHHRFPDNDLLPPGVGAAVFMVRMTSVYSVVTVFALLLAWSCLRNCLLAMRP